MKVKLALKLFAWMSLVLLSFAVGYYATLDERPITVRLDTEVRLYESDGTEAASDLSHLRRPAVAFLLAAECPYCAAAVPTWLDLAARLQQAGNPRANIAVLSYSSVAPTEAFIGQYELAAFRVFYLNAEAGRALGSSSVPATLVLPENAEALLWPGRLGEVDIEGILESLGVR